MLDRKLATKYPLAVVLMELAHRMRLRRLVLRAHWPPRLENEEADALTNYEFHHFSAKNRVKVDLDDIRFGVFRGLFESGEAYYRDLGEKRAEAREDRQGGKEPEGKRKKLMGGTLREREPWD